MPSDNTPSLPLYPPGWPVEWQQSLDAFVRHLATQPGATTKSLQEARRVLVSCFRDGRLPADYSGQDVVSFLADARTFQSRHKPLSEVQQRQWLSIIAAFYDFAAKCSVQQTDGSKTPLYQGMNPAHHAAKIVGKVSPGPGATKSQEQHYYERVQGQQAKTQSLELNVIEDDNWKRCLADFLLQIYKHGKSKSTLRTYAYELRVFFSGSAGSGPKHPEAYTRQDVLAHIHRPCQSHRNPGGEPSPSTRISRLTVLSSFYHYAESYTVEGADGRPQRLLQVAPPTLGITREKLAHREQEKALTIEEIRRFFSVIDTSTVQGARDFTIWTFYLLTLRRREAIARLTWGNLSQGVVTDEQGHTREVWCYSFTEKGGGGQVERLELPQQCMDNLLHYLRLSGRLDTIKPEDPLFVAHGPVQGGGRRSARENAPLHSDSIAHNFKATCERAGLSCARFSLHSLRHSGIQQRIQAGQDWLGIMRISGHANMKSFYHYAQRLTGKSDEFAQVLEKRFDFLGVK